jgi:hypothetical protein
MIVKARLTLEVEVDDLGDAKDLVGFLKHGHSGELDFYPYTVTGMELVDEEPSCPSGT